MNIGRTTNIFVIDAITVIAYGSRKLFFNENFNENELKTQNIII